MKPTNDSQLAAYVLGSIVYGIILIALYIAAIPVVLMIGAVKELIAWIRSFCITFSQMWKDDYWKPEDPNG